MNNVAGVNIFLLIALPILLVSCEKEKKSLPMDADGNTYSTIVIGTQTWLNENLKTTKYTNGDPIPLAADNTGWTDFTRGAYCWYENNINYKDSYGALYNGYAGRASSFICPVGYHVPSLEEWSELVNFLSNDLDAKQQFVKGQFGWRVWNGSFSKYPCSWWIYTSSGSTYRITNDFLITSMPINSGYYIRCLKDN
ncbi:MAG: FISUMP domain-containing protein [Bacteroidales bacterium]